MWETLQYQFKLNYHRAIHGEERAFLCSECGKTFKTRTSLTIHNCSPDRWTKHYPYRILVEKRLETQRKREAAAATDSNNVKVVKQRRKSNLSKGTVIVEELPPTESSEVLIVVTQDFTIPWNFVHIQEYLKL